MSSSSSRSRRVHSEQFKAEVLAACKQPGASIREIARRHGVHVNLVHKWRGKTLSVVGQPKRVEKTKRDAFIAVPLKAERTTEQLVVQVRRGGTEVVMYWPLSHAKQCMQSLLAVCDDAA